MRDEATRAWATSIVVAVLAAALCAFLLSYSVVFAIGGAANAECVCTLIPGQPPGLPFCLTKTCTDATNGITKGHCASPGICHADSFSGAGQSGSTGLDQVAKILGDLFQKLLQGKPPGGGGAPPPSAPPPAPPTGSTGCSDYIQVSEISQLQGNPCARYAPSVSSQINGGSELTGALGDQSGVNLSESLLGSLNANTNDNANGAATNLSTSILQTTSTASVPQGSVGLIPTLPGIFGDFKLLDSGATIIAGTRNEQQNTETSGFYGSGSLGGRPQGLVGQWCSSRPWASNFLSFIIPPTFFDGLCTQGGYEVGSPTPPQQSPSLQQKVIPAAQGETSSRGAAAPDASSAPAVPPKVDIWAVPAAVPLGARTTIFWNTQGVVNCAETSSDGSFNQNSLSGGAATVPIAGATTFSISCEVPDGSQVTGYVVVNLSI